MSKNNQNYGTLQIGSINYPLQKTTYSSILAIEYNTEELHSLRRDLHGLKDTIEIQGVRLRS